MAGERLGRVSLQMALGTTVARLTGYFRSILLVAALGSALHADLFSIANTVPSMLVVLLGAGIFNAVLVPQIVRADREGRGTEYLNQVITLFALVLLVATIAITAAAPIVLRLFLSGDLNQPNLTAQHDSAIAFAYFCLPQVFFYGIYALIGQILNARGVFGPMMWSPVLNNVVSIAVLAVYLTSYGPNANGCNGYDAAQERLLGLGMTAGVAVQCVALLPLLGRVGIRYRPTLQLMSPRVRSTLRLGAWTIAVVLVNQAAYTVVVRLASAGTAGGAACGASPSGTGYTVYSSAYLLIMAPHAVVTVSLMTARLPTLARLGAAGLRTKLGSELGASLRLAMTFIVPGIALLELLSGVIANLAFGYGAGARSSQRFVPTLACFGIALFFFTAHYVALRGLYALEDNRAVMGIQSLIAVVNVSAAVVGVHAATSASTAPALAAAYGVAYAAGSVTSWSLLRSRLGTIDGKRTVATLALLIAAAGLATLGCVALSRVAGAWLVVDPASKPEALAVAGTTSLVFVMVFLLAGWWTGVAEVRDLCAAAWRRIRPA